MIENNTRNTNVQTYIPINDLYHQHEKYEITVERAKKLFLEKWVILNTLWGFANIPSKLTLGYFIIIHKL